MLEANPLAHPVRDVAHGGDSSGRGWGVGWVVSDPSWMSLLCEVLSQFVVHLFVAVVVGEVRNADHFTT